jgi:phage tail-like protein
MALTRNEIKDAYPLPVYNYRVTIGSDTLGFSEVSGLGVEHEPVTYRHGFSFAMGVKIIPGMRQPSKLTLKRGIAKGSAFLADWLKNTYANPLKNSKQDIVIDLCDETGKAVVRWSVQSALPIKLEAPTFDANSNSVAIETLELIAAGITINYDPG